MKSTVYRMEPTGASTVTVSLGRWPKKAGPRGASAEMRESSTRASSGPTILYRWVSEGSLVPDGHRFTQRPPSGSNRATLRGS